MRYHQSIIVMMLFFCISAIAQVENRPVNHHVSIAIFDEHIAAPFDVRKGAPSHLGGSVAFERSRKRTGIYQFTHIFQGGFYYHQDFNQVAFLIWKPKFELQVAHTFNIHAILGIGYAHSFPVRQTYSFNNGSYKKKTNLGKPHAMPSIGFGAGFNLEELLELPIELFSRYEAFSLAPYALKGRVPVTLNTMLSFGIKYTIKK